MKVLFTIPLVILQALIGGLVFSKMWNWFVVTRIPEAPTLDHLGGVGMMMVLHFPLLSLTAKDIREVLKKEAPELKDSTIGLTVTLLMTFVVYPLVLFGAYVWSIFING